MNIFSRMVRLGTTDSPTRSAHTRFTPPLVASRGEAGLVGCPSREIPPATRRAKSKEHPAHKFVAGASQANKADHLTGVNCTIDRPDVADVEILKPQPCGSLTLRWPPKHLGRFTP